MEDPILDYLPPHLIRLYQLGPVRESILILPAVAQDLETGLRGQCDHGIGMFEDCKGCLSDGICEAFCEQEAL